MDWLAEFLAWVWARHHNMLSWYVRPLFILPFCYFAYKRNAWGMLLTVLLLPTSLFWFPAPARPDPQVLAYLAWERAFLTGENVAAKLVFAVLVVVFFWALAAAFWKRNMLWGLAVLNVATLLKIVWSVVFGGTAGWASLLPAVVTLLVCDIAIVLAGRLVELRRTRRTSP